MANAFDPHGCTTSCPPDSHVHCVSDGAVLFAEGGGGDDGRSICGYTDALTCRDCSEAVCDRTSCRFEIVGLGVLCKPCLADRLTPAGAACCFP